MKGISVLLGLIGFLTAETSAQSDSVRLRALSQSRLSAYKEQTARANEYARIHQRPIAFTDEKGNHVRLVGVAPNGLPVYFNTLNANAAITTGAIQLHNGGPSGLNLQGEGMVVDVWDGGLIKDHIEFGTRVIGKESLVEDTHATHVTGTLIATGINPAARGMAPLAKANTHYFDNDESEMAGIAKLGPASLSISNHSYGTATGWFKNNGAWEWSGYPAISPIEDYRFGFYDTRAETIDKIAYLAPYYTIVWAAGNDRGDVGDGSKPVDCNGGSGYDCIIPEGVAKNIITVGAVNKVPSYSNAYDVTMSFFSSWGPTDDGRIKPDIVADGVDLFSLSAVGTNTYTTLSGTSMSTPNTTGSLMLVQELYRKMHGGDFMKASTLKALAIHTAKEAGSFPGPDYSFGWGLLDVATAAKTLTGEDEQNILIEELTLTQGNSYTRGLHPKANQRITATIVWADPPATPLTAALDPTNLMLINDLDIRIVDDRGREQLPWILDPSNPSKGATRSDNFRDNVEKIEFDFPEGRDYSLVVRHKSALKSGKQDFSLILSYTSTHIPNTFYWIGNSGDWSDGTHWSLTSGGSSTLQVPGANDKVIVDENSFSGSGPGNISLAQNISCSELLWLCGKPSGIALNDKVLTITSRCVIGSSAFAIAAQGRILFQSANSVGSFLVERADLTKAVLDFDGGTWTVKGIIKADELRLSSGILNIEDGKLFLGRLATASGLPREMRLTRTNIDLTESSTMDGTGLTISTGIASLNAASATVTLEWQKVGFPGELVAAAGSKIIINGDNRIGKLSVEGEINLNGSNQIDSLFVRAGAVIRLNNSTSQKLSPQTSLLGTALKPVTITAASHAGLSFEDHSKFCFDFLSVTNVDVSGASVVNAGTGSTLLNSNQWQQKNCDDVLFADFDFRYNCANSLTVFLNKSAGPVTGYSWRFGTSTEEAHEMNPVRKIGIAGSVPVTLTVAGDGATNSATRDIAIVPNTLGSNRITSGDGLLTSLSLSPKYQWYENGLPVAGAVGRSFVWGDEGNYFVVTYDAQCNISSDTLVIAGFAEGREGLEVFPVPAVGFIHLKVPRGASATITLTDLRGENYLEQTVNQSEVTMPTHGIPDGWYILQVRTAGGVARKRIMVSH